MCVSKIFCFYTRTLTITLFSLWLFFTYRANKFNRVIWKFLVPVNYIIHMIDFIQLNCIVFDSDYLRGKMDNLTIWGWAKNIKNSDRSLKNWLSTSVSSGTSEETKIFKIVYCTKIAPWISRGPFGVKPSIRAHLVA